MRILYNIFFILFALIYLPYFIIKKKARKDFIQRFGVFDKGLLAGIAPNRPIWIHAVSVGEMKAAEGLIERVRPLFPSKRLVISNVTKTGREIALSIAAKEDVVIYLPLDLTFVVKKAIKEISPCLFISIETEIWPNLISALHDVKIPIALINGRISAKSFANYMLIKPVMSNILSKITLFAMRTKDDAERIITLGAPSDRVKVTGNMKFDMIHKTPDSAARSFFPIERKDLWLSPSAKLIIAGSTHRGEDAKIISAFKSLRNDFPAARLLIAPRHIERVNEVTALISKFGLRPVRMSEIVNGRDVRSLEDCVFLLDSIGSLKALYRIAAVVIMGGSLVPRGGHNFAEPAAAAKPIITGPFVDNFKDMAELFLNERALEVVSGEEGLATSLRTLLFDENKRKIMGENARKVVMDNVGSTERNALLLMDLVIAELKEPNYA